MWGRNSVVQHILVYSLLSNAVIEIGDVVQIRSATEALAVQRQQEIYYGKEADFRPRLFFEHIPIPPFPLQPPLIRKHHENPNIHVGKISIKGVSTASVVQIGNNDYVLKEAWVFHERELSGQPVHPRTKVEVRRD